MNPRFTSSEGSPSRSGWIRAEFTQHVRKRCEAISAILFHHDPVGVSIGSNQQAYDDAAAAIVPRLIECRSEVDARSVVYLEACRIFGAEKAGAISAYSAVSAAIWALWRSTP